MNEKGAVIMNANYLEETRPKRDRTLNGLYAPLDDDGLRTVLWSLKYHLGSDKVVGSVRMNLNALHAELMNEMARREG